MVRRRDAPPVVARLTHLPFFTGVALGLTVLLTLLWALVAARTLHGVRQGHFCP